MDWLELESFGLDCPLLADELVGREAVEGFEPSSEIVGVEEVGEVAAQLVVVVVVIPFDGRLLDVRFIRSTWPFVQGWFGLVSRCSMLFRQQHDRRDDHATVRWALSGSLA